DLEWWWEHPDIGHRIVVSVDELMLITGAATKDELTPFRSLTGGRLTELAAASRSCGMHLDMATQYGIAQAGGSSGSLMRFNLSGRMVVGASNPDGLKAAFDEPVPDHIATHLSGTIPGRCLYAQLNRHHGQEITPGQIWKVTQSDAEALVPSEPTHLVHDFDAVAALQLLDDTPKTNSGRNRR
ncbi:MAG: hypothetical protein GY926_24060, partial [bacterium]|nr:hypothetical protein [bacterium]